MSENFKDDFELAMDHALSYDSAQMLLRDAMSVPNEHRISVIDMQLQPFSYPFSGDELKKLGLK